MFSLLHCTNLLIQAELKVEGVNNLCEEVTVRIKCLKRNGRLLFKHPVSRFIRLPGLRGRTP